MKYKFKKKIKVKINHKKKSYKNYNIVRHRHIVVRYVIKTYVTIMFYDCECYKRAINQSLQFNIQR